MRTYTLREVRGEGESTRLVVDFVLHVEDGETGPRVGLGVDRRQVAFMGYWRRMSQCARSA
jgi:NADPH-dependent ferric siderophore reductase